MFALADKKALVTGASGGIGGAIARAMHEQGATVALAGRNPGQVQCRGPTATYRGHPTHHIAQHLQRTGTVRGGPHPSHDAPSPKDFENCCSPRVFVL